MMFCIKNYFTNRSNLGSTDFILFLTKGSTEWLILFSILLNVHDIF